MPVRLETDSVLSFLSQIKRTHVSPKLALYRGQRDIAWPIVPKISRSPFANETNICKSGHGDRSAERRLYLLFRDYTTALTPTWVRQGDPKSVSWRILVLAQHHGVPTRFLELDNKPFSSSSTHGKMIFLPCNELEHGDGSLALQCDSPEHGAIIRAPWAVLRHPRPAIPRGRPREGRYADTTSCHAFALPLPEVLEGPC